MKLTLLAIALALPCLAQASYSFKIPLEMAQGGALENGSIVFNKPATTPTKPVEPNEPEQPSEPVEPDPFELEDSRCDPYATTYPENYWGREKPTNSNLIEVDENGNFVRYNFSCKLKNEDENVLAKYQDVINPTYVRNGVTYVSNYCEKTPVGGNLNAPMSCEVWGSNSYFNYKYTKDSSGNINRDSFTYNVATLFLTDVELQNSSNRFFVKGRECINLRQKKNYFGVVWNGHFDCDLVEPITYDEIVRDTGKRFIIEIRKS
ncbi:hypothetical protein ACCE15_19270 [Pseudomonas parafulva]|uniref:hypothetical protein n=1 Tax=Pseudomonas parafulva TaxID=157782 RepID=UPI0035623E85